MKQNPSADAFLLASRIQQELETYVDPVKRTYLPGFFKTGKGQYGEGDEFLGIVVPNTRLVAKRHKAEPFEVAAALLQSRWHECRLCALLMLVERFKKCDETARKEIVDFYLAHTTRINNWDLVDLSAPYILGEYLKDKPRDVLHHLASSTLLWDQRIAVVATQTLIKNGDFTDILLLAPRFFQTPHDLMQKAVGWMLREVGKKNEAVLVGFLQQHARSMPRTMLRYAIEKFPDGQRRKFMKR
ncbi:DNA alkylation repair protein [Mediterranea massiliensis]|uniref:DNA alkylation repair protein n=1 Tax=Mediterranea massiliensis TaxID=1841865 RepID=UPI0025A3966A|nr:DNA alkylation repair protein [Mediterranea massiliensis]MDM8336172.1 DNA alkylation repair protein [Mediterranea massiliensis]